MLGVIDVQDDEPGAFTETDVALMETLADQLAAAMQLAELFADLHRGRMFTEHNPPVPNEGGCKIPGAYAERQDSRY